MTAQQAQRRIHYYVWRARQRERYHFVMNRHGEAIREVSQQLSKDVWNELIYRAVNGLYDY